MLLLLHVKHLLRTHSEWNQHFQHIFLVWLRPQQSSAIALILFTPRSSVFMPSIQLFFCNTEPITLLVRASVNPEISSTFLITAVQQRPSYLPLALIPQSYTPLEWQINVAVRCLEMDVVCKYPPYEVRHSEIHCLLRTGETEVKTLLLCWLKWLCVLS